MAIVVTTYESNDVAISDCPEMGPANAEKVAISYLNDQIIPESDEADLRAVLTSLGCEVSEYSVRVVRESEEWLLGDKNGWIVSVQVIELFLKVTKYPYVWYEADIRDGDALLLVETNLWSSDFSDITIFDFDTMLEAQGSVHDVKRQYTTWESDVMTALGCGMADKIGAFTMHAFDNLPSRSVLISASIPGDYSGFVCCPHHINRCELVRGANAFQGYSGYAKISFDFSNDEYDWNRRTWVNSNITIDDFPLDTGEPIFVLTCTVNKCQREDGSYIDLTAVPPGDTILYYGASQEFPDVTYRYHFANGAATQFSVDVAEPPTLPSGPGQTGGSIVVAVLAVYVGEPPRPEIEGDVGTGVNIADNTFQDTTIALNRRKGILIQGNQMVGGDGISITESLACHITDNVMYGCSVAATVDGSADVFFSSNTLTDCGSVESGTAIQLDACTNITISENRAISNVDESLRPSVVVAEGRGCLGVALVQNDFRGAFTGESSHNLAELHIAMRNLPDEDVPGIAPGVMLASTYDANNNGIVDAAESVPWSGVSGAPTIPANLDDLSDVVAPSPTDGQSLVWVSSVSKWQPVTVTGSGGATALDDLTDVDLDSPTDGQILAYDATSFVWRAQTFLGSTSDLDDLTDVDAPSPSDGQVLTYNATSFVWQAQTLTLDDLADVDAQTPENGQVLTWNGSANRWEPATVEGSFGGGTFSGILTFALDFQPEYPNALFVPSSITNGTVQMVDDSTARINAYSWTSSIDSEQTIEIVLRFRLPVGFYAWTTPLRVMSKVDTLFSVCAVEVAEFLDTAGNNVITPTTRRNETWQENDFAVVGGTWTAQGICTLRFRMYGKLNEIAYLGPVRIGYTVNVE